MVRAIGGLFVQLLMALIVFTVNVGFALAASFIRSLPWLIPLAVRFSRQWLVLTCRFYLFALTPLNRIIRRRLHINLFARAPRRIAIILLSLGMGGLLLLMFQPQLHVGYWLVQIPFGVWLLALCILYGLLVDRAWEDVPDDSGLHMGERL